MLEKLYHTGKLKYNPAHSIILQNGIYHKTLAGENI